MDGLQIAREIRRSFGSEIPILLISAYDWTEFEEEAREAGISGFISKPLFKSTLFYGLRQYMGLQATHQPASSHEMCIRDRNTVWPWLPTKLTLSGATPACAHTASQASALSSPR